MEIVGDYDETVYHHEETGYHHEEKEKFQWLLEDQHCPRKVKSDFAHFVALQIDAELENEICLLLENEICLLLLLWGLGFLVFFQVFQKNC